MAKKPENKKEDNKKIESEQYIIDTDRVVICIHCGKPILQLKLVGNSLVCPSCGKSQNEQAYMQARK